MSDIKIILSPPSFQAVLDSPRRASLSIVLKTGREKLRQSISFEEPHSLKYNLPTLLLFTALGPGSASVLTHTLAGSLGFQGYAWIVLLTLVVLATGSCVNLKDQEGDQASGHWTIPRIIGDETARHCIAGAMVILSICALRFWGTQFAGSMLVFGLAGAVVKRLMIGDKEGYQTTFKLWSCWLVSLYLLPAMGRA